MTQIGKPIRIREVEPIDLPMIVPIREPEREPEKVPVRVDK